MTNEDLSPSNKILREKKKRFDVVFGIIVASIFGFLINILASIVYNYFFLVEPQKVEQQSILTLVVAIFINIIFLNFIIYDFQNDLNLNKSFWMRFFDYFENKNRASKGFLKAGLWIYNFLVKAFLVFLLFAFFKTSLWLGVTLLLLVIVFYLGKYLNKKRKIKNKNIDLETSGDGLV